MSTFVFVEPISVKTGVIFLFVCLFYWKADYLDD